MFATGAVHAGLTRRTIYLPEKVLEIAFNNGYDYWSIGDGSPWRGQRHFGRTDRRCDLPPWNVPISRVRIWDTSKGDSMSRKRYTAEQIIGHLRQAEIRTSEGKTIAEAVRELGISEQTYYRWRKQYGGMEVNQARRLKELEQENGRLKRLVADQALDLSIHKEVSRGNF